MKDPGKPNNCGDPLAHSDPNTPTILDLSRKKAVGGGSGVVKMQQKRRYVNQVSAKWMTHKRSLAEGTYNFINIRIRQR